MTVSIPPGWLAVPLQAGQGSALCIWDAAEVVGPLAAGPPAGQTRIDLIVCQVRDNAIDGGANNDFVFAVVQGVPAAANPAVPAVPPNALAVCQVLVPATAVTLNAATVSDARLSAELAYAVANRQAQQALASAVNLQVSFDAVTFDPSGMWNPQQPGRLTVRVPGLYLAVWGGTLAAGAGGAVQWGLWKNGASDRAGLVLNPVSWGALNSVVPNNLGLTFCQPGDYLQCNVWQNSGAQLQILSASLGLVLLRPSNLQTG